MNYICTDTQTDASAAMQFVRDEPHSLECRNLFASEILSEESDENRRRYEETQRRREAAGVPLELRPGRVEELPPAKGAGKATHEPRDPRRTCQKCRMILWISGCAKI